MQVDRKDNKRQKIKLKYENTEIKEEKQQEINKVKWKTITIKGDNKKNNITPHLKKNKKGSK